MKTNDYSIAEFKKQYIGIWDPSNEHWFGLDFIYNQMEYRFDTGTMYGEDDNGDENGVIHKFGLYKKLEDDNDGYELLVECISVDEVLNCTVIDNKKFEDILVDDMTEIIGQD